MNWYKRQPNQLIESQHHQLIEGLTFEEILKRIDSAKQRIQIIESQEKFFTNRLNKEENEFIRKLFNNRLLALQKSFNTASETLDKYIQMIEHSDEVKS